MPPAAHDTPHGDDPRRVPAPELDEVARIWWDVDETPQVVWDATATDFDLVDPTDDARRLALLRLASPAEDPRGLAATLADGLASCDFPPTGRRASPTRVRATLRAARVSVEPHPSSVPIRVRCHTRRHTRRESGPGRSRGDDLPDGRVDPGPYVAAGHLDLLDQ